MKQTPPRLGLLDDIPTHEILEGLARVHQLVFVADSHGRIVWMSDALGVICGGVPGDDARHLCSRLPQLAYPEEIASFRDDLKKRDTLTDVRIKLQHKDGGLIEADTSAFKVDSGEPEKPLYVIVVRPVAERDRSDRELRNTVDFLAAVLDSAPDGVIATDRAGFITYVNSALLSLVKRESEELIGKPAAGFMSSFTGFGRVLSALQTGAEITGEDIGLHRADDSEIWMSISSRILRLPSGEAAGTVSYLRDVTERRRAQQKLERKNVELESYVHSVSHDLRSPLVSLLGFSRLLKQDYAGLLDETGRHFLDRIEQASRTMEALIADLLELSRIGASEEYRTLIDPRSVLLQLQAEFKPQLDEKGVRLEIPAVPPMVFSDRTRLYQVFSNLIGNALNHMGPCERPEIRVEISEYPGHHLISISDNGKGIAREDHERVFELFRTLETPRDGRRSTGVGLAIVKKIVETQDGRVWVESAPARGARFLIALPSS
jgi:two-component system sensor kinase FixL